MYERSNPAIIWMAIKARVRLEVYLCESWKGGIIDEMLS